MAIVAAPRQLPALDAAINRESWELLEREYPDFADALEAEIARGATCEDVRRFIDQKLRDQRGAMALRLEQAAAHLIAVRDGE